MSAPFDGGAVVITGGTRGLGKALGLEFAKAGASVFLTHRWGVTDEAELAAEFAAESLPAPCIIEADASDTDATLELMKTVAARTGRLHAVISNVAFAKRVDTVEDLKRNSLELSLRYSAWPVVDLVQASHSAFGHYPRYVIGVSSDGGRVCHPGYDFAGASKAVLETLCRYLALRLRGDGVRVNAIRPGFLDTDSARATFGDALIDTMQARIGEILLDPRAVARVCVALCSGQMDAITGQVIDVDEGWSLVSPVTYLSGRGWPAGFPKTQDR
jgi:NAD(P)-dependent dehydrogenase (short-subunit alcohol dehydrogenase family)